MDREELTDGLTVLRLPSWARTLRELNVRDGRSKKAQVIRMLAVGEDVHLVGLSGMRAQINSPCTGWISTMTSAKEMCLELPDGPWPVPAPAEPASADTDGAGAMAVAATVSQDVNEDALSLYDLPVIRLGWAMTLLQVNVRKGRGKRTELLGSLPVKTRIYILEVVETRARINDPYEGWISVVTPDRTPAVTPLELEVEEAIGVEEEVLQAPPAVPSAEPSAELQPSDIPSTSRPAKIEDEEEQAEDKIEPKEQEKAEGQEGKEVRIVEPTSSLPSEESKSSSTSSASSDSSEAVAAPGPKAKAAPKVAARPRTESSTSEESDSESSNDSSQASATSSSAPVALKGTGPAATGQSSKQTPEDGPGWWWTHLKAIVSRGESRLTEVVGHLPPGKTVFVQELRNQCAFIREPFEGWIPLRSPSGQVVLSTEAPANAPSSVAPEAAEPEEAEESEKRTAEVSEVSEVSEPVPGRLHRPSQATMQTEQAPVPREPRETEQADAANPVEQGEQGEVEPDADVKGVKGTTDMQEDEEVKVEKVLEVQEVEPTVKQTQEEAKLEVIDVVQDKDIEMQDQQQINVPDAAGFGAGSGRLWKPDTFEQDVDEMLKKRKLKMGTAPAPPATPEMKTVKKLTVEALSLAAPSADEATEADRSIPSMAMASTARPLQPQVESTKEEKVEKVEKVQERVQTGSPLVSEIAGADGGIAKSEPVPETPPLAVARPTKVSQLDKGEQPERPAEWHERDSLQRLEEQLEEQLRRIEDPINLGAIDLTEPSADVGTKSKEAEGLAPAVPSGPDPWPSLHLCGNEDVEQVATEFLRRAAEEEWRRGRGGVGAGQMPPVDCGESQAMPLEAAQGSVRLPPALEVNGAEHWSSPTPPRPLPGSPMHARPTMRKPKRDEPRSGPIPAWVYESPSPEPSSPDVTRPHAITAASAAAAIPTMSPGNGGGAYGAGIRSGGCGGAISGMGDTMLRSPPRTDTSAGLVGLQHLLKLQEQQLQRQVQLQEQQFQLQEMQLRQQEQQLQARRQEQQQQEQLNEMRQNLHVMEQQELRHRSAPKATLSRPVAPMTTGMPIPATMQIPLDQQHQQQDLLSHILLLHQSAQLQLQVQTEQERHLRELQQQQQVDVLSEREKQPNSFAASERSQSNQEMSPQQPHHADHADSVTYEDIEDLQEEVEEEPEATHSISETSDLWHGRWRQHQERPPSEFIASERSKPQSQSQATSFSPTPTPSQSSAP